VLFAYFNARCGVFAVGEVGLLGCESGGFYVFEQLKAQGDCAYCIDDIALYSTPSPCPAMVGSFTVSLDRQRVAKLQCADREQQACIRPRSLFTGKAEDPGVTPIVLRHVNCLVQVNGA